jgi:high-affinity Fe2+/Pb2+ permease
MGIEASAWIMLVVYFVMCVLSYLQGQKHYPIPYDLGTMVLVLIASVLISGLTRFLLPEDALIRFLISNLVLGISLLGLYKLILKAVRSEKETG